MPCADDHAMSAAISLGRNVRPAAPMLGRIDRKARGRVCSAHRSRARIRRNAEARSATHLDSTQTPTVSCHHALPNQIAAAVVVVAAIAVRITVSADPYTKTAKSASAKATSAETSASVTPYVTTCVTTYVTTYVTPSGRYGWRNQANCRHCEQGDDCFTQHMFSPRWKELALNY
jgi:hypothetical protein